MKNLISLHDNDIFNSVYNVSGFAPVIGYEPWVLRTIESVKESLIAGQPMLMRLHSAAAYPTDSNDKTIDLDMESHAVLIVGYDDFKKEFDIIDPWNSTWGGSNFGIRTIKYEEMPIVCVNATAEKITRFSTVQKEVCFTTDASDNHSVNLQLGFYIPKGYIIDEKQSTFVEYKVDLNYSIDNEEYNYHKVIKGNWCVGDIAEIEIPLGKGIGDDVEVHFDVEATLKGTRPYEYTDIIKFSFDETVCFNNTTKTLSEFENLAKVSYS